MLVHIYKPHVQLNNDSYSNFQRVSTIGGIQYYNKTLGFEDTLIAKDLTDKTNPDNDLIKNLGIVASSPDPLFVIGVKSDRGTTDAFMVLPVVEDSMEFVIAGWPLVQYFSYLLIIIF